MRSARHRADSALRSPSSVSSTGQISAANQPISRSSSARAGSRKPNSARIWARWYSIVLPDHGYCANSAGSTLTCEAT